MFGTGSGVTYVAGESGWDAIEFLRRQTESKRTEPARPRILVVDDEQLIAETTVEILDSVGFDARAAYDGWTALEIAREFRPDYLLTDVLMPRMNGVELAIAISKSLPATRIFLFSGQAGISEVLLHGHQQGYDFELVAKPVHPTKLIERLRSQ
jgi:CheY-like chemotaxis protein